MVLDHLILIEWACLRLLDARSVDSVVPRRVAKCDCPDVQPNAVTLSCHQIWPPYRATGPTVDVHAGHIKEVL